MVAKRVKSNFINRLLFHSCTYNKYNDIWRGLVLQLSPNFDLGKKELKGGYKEYE